MHDSVEETSEVSDPFYVAVLFIASAVVVWSLVYGKLHLSSVIPIAALIYFAERLHALERRLMEQHRETSQRIKSLNTKLVWMEERLGKLLNNGV